MAALPITFSVEPQFKETFAGFLHRGYTPLVAAMQLWPADASFALRVSELWINDEYVLAYREKLKAAEVAKDKPPTKDAQIKRIEAKLNSLSDDNYIKGERLIAEMCGHIEKAAPAQVNVQQNTFERVMIVKDHGDDAAWEKKTAAQQAKLIEGSRA